LQVLLDRNLREKAIVMNEAETTLQKTNVKGIWHEYWVDKKSGFSGHDQTDLIQFLLLLDDDSSELPLEIAQAINYQ